MTGGIPLCGTIVINGAKNAALPLMALGLLTDQPLALEGVPLVGDVHTLQEILEELGTSIMRLHNYFVLKTHRVTSTRASYERVRKMRASILVLGALLGRCGEAEVSLPGGCAIGARPVNLHLDGLRALGVTIDIEHGYIVAKAPKGRVRGGMYEFPKVSVTGSMNVLLAAVLAEGESCLKNVALEPELGDFITCLKKMGAVIEREGSTLWIQGQSSLGGAQHKILPDRIELGTYMVAAAITRGNLLLENADISLVMAAVDLLRKIGAVVEEVTPNTIRVMASDALEAFSMRTGEFPEMATDLQAQFMALATLGQGTSEITETIFDNRFMHVCELIRMGAHIELEGNHAVVFGQKRLMGAPVMATDLRASASLVLAALAAEGTTIIRRVYHLDRGYEGMEIKLAQCGAQIQRLTTQPEQDELLVVRA